MTEEDPAAIAKAIIDANLYMVQGTADESGQPWVTPVYFAVADYREFLWVSYPDARHSRNIVVRPRVAIAIFDSRVPINTGQGVYLSADAEATPDGEIDEAMAVFSARSVSHGGGQWRRAKVEPPAALRLYRATAFEHSVLIPGGPDRRTPYMP